jgi:nucleolar protein 12
MAKGHSVLTAPKKAVDPALDALFSSSAGPIKPPQKSRYVELLSKKPRDEPVSEDSDQNESADEDGDEDDEELSELDEELDDEASISEGSSEGESESESDNASDDSSADEEDEAAEVLEVMVDHGKGVQDDGRKRKRKQRDEYDNLESKYLNRLADEEEEPTGKRLKGDKAPAADAMDISADDGVDSDAESSSDDAVPVHESLSADSAATDLEKANRTVFISNVSAEAVTSRKAKKTLLNHLSSILDKKASPPQKIESIRFRSTAFSTAAIPKRAAYIKKSVMEATTKSTNAYVVYSSTLAARLAAAELNGTVVLDRHIRVDSVAHPAAIDHRRCVFVGNLGFMDDETVLATKVDEEGKEVTEKKKRTKVPMDVEEGLWRVFSKEAGKVESVRVVRDPVTRVGKGFAYVQFYVSLLTGLVA